MTNKGALHEAIEKKAMDKLKNKWSHLYSLGYPKRPFPINYENDLNCVIVGMYAAIEDNKDKEFTENDLKSACSYYSMGRSIDSILEMIRGNNEEINQAISDLKLYVTTPKHAEIYGFLANKPLFVEGLCDSEGISDNVLEYIDNYARKNGNDIIFGHIEKTATFTKESKQSNIPDMDLIKKLLNSNGYETIEGNNDFYKIIKKNANSNPDNQLYNAV